MLGWELSARNFRCPLNIFYPCHVLYYRHALKLSISTIVRCSSFVTYVLYYYMHRSNLELKSKPYRIMAKCVSNRKSNTYTAVSPTAFSFYDVLYEKEKTVFRFVAFLGVLWCLALDTTKVSLLCYWTVLEVKNRRLNAPIVFFTQI